MKLTNAQTKKTYYNKHRVRILAGRNERRRIDPAFKVHQNKIKRDSLLRTRYGITREQYDDMLTRQGGGCAICQAVSPNNGRGNHVFDVDHDHSTGAVRGLLCRDCNMTIGTLEKKQYKLEAIYAYLADHAERGTRHASGQSA